MGFWGEASAGHTVVGLRRREAGGEPGVSNVVAGDYSWCQLNEPELARLPAISAEGGDCDPNQPRGRAGNKAKKRVGVGTGVKGRELACGVGATGVVRDKH